MGILLWWWLRERGRARGSVVGWWVRLEDLWWCCGVMCGDVLCSAV